MPRGKRKKHPSHKAKPVALPKATIALAAPKPRKNPPASMPPDLCSWLAVAAGFGQLEPVGAFGDQLLLASDPPGTAKSLAAESVAHLVEAWRYLASASSSVLVNAKAQVIHLAYYAELRAAFALFSCSGIRISQPKHWYLNSAGLPSNPPWVKARTHTAAWELWKDWTKGTYADQLFSDRLRIAPAVPLRAVTQEITRASASPALLAWGFDLLSLSSDHLARNQASYNPTITQATMLGASQGDLDFLREMWQLLQPTSTGLQFELSFVHYMIDVEIADRTTQGGFDVNAWYASLARDLAANTGAQESELEPMLRDRTNSTRLFTLAAASAPTWEAVMARAVFLVRLASKAVEDALGTQAGSSGKPWLRYWLAHAGLRSGGAAPRDLWSDFEDLPSFVSPAGPIPDTFRLSPLDGVLAQRLARPDAAIAWGMSL